MFTEGREPPRASDSGWGGRSTKASGDAAEISDTPKPSEEVMQNEETEKQGKSRGGRGGRGGRGRGRGGRQGGEREGSQKGSQRGKMPRVISLCNLIPCSPISSKADRTALHQVVRELFGGKFDSETDMLTSAGDDGSRIVIKWSRNGGGRGGGRGGRGGMFLPSSNENKKIP